MSEKEVIELVKDLKSDAVRSQMYDAASILRSIENKFNGNDHHGIKDDYSITVESMIKILEIYVLSMSAESKKFFGIINSLGYISDLILKLKTDLRDRKIDEITK